MSVVDTILTASIIGIGTGLGTAIGQYFSQKLVVRHLEKFEKQILNKRKGLRA